MSATVAAFLGGLGPLEIILILAIILLLFGATRIPDLARSLGKGVNEFKKGLKGDEPGDPMRIEEGKSKALEDKEKKA